MSKGKLLTRARQMLGIPQLGTKKGAIFSAAARRLGKPWNGGKAAGYQLLQELVGDAPPLRPKRRSAVTGVDVNSDAFLLGYEWRRLRMIVLKKRGARCECCGFTAKDGVKIHVDHIKPRRRYPELALVESNLQILCEVCNHGKGSWDETDWREPDPATYQPCWAKAIDRIN